MIELKRRRPRPAEGELLDLGPVQTVFAQSDRIVIDVPERHLQVLVVRRNDQLFATEARCPHLGWPLDDAIVRAGSITCRGHGICFDLRTGSPKPGNRRVRLAVYPAWTEEGTLRVLLPPR